MSSEEFNLKWTDFESNISVAFRELREEKDFFDITLVCDNDQIQAHKVILSACSPFFRSILTRNPHPHPLIYLRGVGLSNLQSVLDFMYNGEVNVAQEELNSFLAVAEELKVKGLAQSAQSQSNGKQKSTSSTPLAKSASPSLPDKQPSTRRPLPTSVLHPRWLSIPLPNNDTAQEFISVKLEPFETLPIHQDLGHSSTAESNEGDFGAEDYQDNGQYEGDRYQANGGFDPFSVACYEDLQQYVVRSESGYKCACGGFSNKSKKSVEYHIESKHFPNHFAWKCNICGKQPKTKIALLTHKYREHPNQK